MKKNELISAGLSRSNFLQPRGSATLFVAFSLFNPASQLRMERRAESSSLSLTSSVTVPLKKALCPHLFVPRVQVVLCERGHITLAPARVLVSSLESEDQASQVELVWASPPPPPQVRPMRKTQWASATGHGSTLGNSVNQINNIVAAYLKSAATSNPILHNQRNLFP